MFLISPEELAWKNLEAEHQEITEEDYKVNIKNLEEEQRVVSLNLENVYRMMDKLDNEAIERLKNIS